MIDSFNATITPAIFEHLLLSRSRFRSACTSRNSTQRTIFAHALSPILASLTSGFDVPTNSLYHITYFRFLLLVFNGLILILMCCVSTTVFTLICLSLLNTMPVRPPLFPYGMVVMAFTNFLLAWGYLLPLVFSWLSPLEHCMACRGE